MAEASGYDFQTKANQQAESSCSQRSARCPKAVIRKTWRPSPPLTAMPQQSARHQALADAEGISYLYFLSDALGRASAKRSSPPTTKASSVRRRRWIKASEVSTGAAKKHFNNPRPFS